VVLLSQFESDHCHAIRKRGCREYELGNSQEFNVYGEEFITGIVDDVAVQHPAENVLSGHNSLHVHVRDNPATEPFDLSSNCWQ